MKPEFINYAKRLYTIGELFEETSNLINIGGAITIESLLDNRKEVDIAIERYEYARDSLEEVKFPEEIKREHPDLVSSISAFIDGLKTLKDSYGAEEGFYDKNKFEKGNEIVNINLAKIQKLTVRIGDILTRKQK